MRTRISGLLMLGLLLVNAQADTTIHFKNTVKFGPQVPPNLQSQIEAGGAGLLPAETLVLIHGSHGYLSGKPYSYLFDFATNQVTLLDDAHRAYTTVPADQLGSLLANQAMSMAKGAGVAAMQQAMAALTMKVDSSDTGKTDTVLGVGVAESQVVLHLGMDLSAIPNAPPQAAAMGAMPLMETRVEIWRATPAELMRHPELREWSDNFATLFAASNPVGTFSSLFAQFPGGGKQVADSLSSLGKNTAPALRTHVTVNMPMLAMMAQMAQSRGADLPAGGDLSSPAPLAESTSEAVSIGTDPIDPAKFNLPAGYQSLPFDQFVKNAAGGTK